MLFNSVVFAFFFLAVFLSYWFVFDKSLKQQNIFLLVVSVFFYCCWDWRFVFLLLFSIGLDFFVGNKIYINSHNRLRKKFWLSFSVFINLGILFFFKYFNFFIDNFSNLIELFGFKPNVWFLKIILPIGISFYTFHGLSYVIDIYKDKITPVKSIVDYSLFVSFFPLLVAGPIERATHLLPQIQKRRFFDYDKSTSGLRQILWGLVKKIIIADNCGEYVNLLFDNPSHYTGSSLFLGTILFSFQIYGDFSGYTDIALGTARLLGIDLLQNFSYPYFSRDIAEFWRRWHISLSSWFRDYVYIPLGGSRGTKWQQIRNVFIIFMLTGFWHGANWTFIIYGFINFLYFLPLLLLHKNRSHLKIVSEKGFVSKCKAVFNIITTFGLVSLARVFFRSKSVEEAFMYFSNMFSKSLFSYPDVFPKKIFVFIFCFICIEWLGRKDLFAIEKLCFRWSKPIRIGFYYVLAILIFYYRGKEFQFIYFQF